MYVCISHTAQPPSSVHFQKMLETSISRRYSFSCLKYKDNLLHILILSIGPICWRQHKVTCVSGRVQLVLMYCHTICPIHFHCYQFANYWKVLLCRIRANKIFVFFRWPGQPSIMCFIAPSTFWLILYGIYNHLQLSVTLQHNVLPVSTWRCHSTS
jgi:hypothetical protein